MATAFGGILAGLFQMMNEPFIKALEEPVNLDAKKEYEMIEKS